MRRHPNGGCPVPISGWASIKHGRRVRGKCPQPPPRTTEFELTSPTNQRESSSDPGPQQPTGRLRDRRELQVSHSNSRIP